MDIRHLSIPSLLLFAGLLALPSSAQDLVPDPDAPDVTLEAETVQELDWLPGNAVSPFGWAVVGRSLGPEGLTFVPMSGGPSCTLGLAKSVQDVVVFEGLVYATLKEGGNTAGGLAVVDPGTDPCSDAVEVGRISGDLNNAQNVRVDRETFGLPTAVVVNSFKWTSCGGGYDASDLGVFFYDIAGPTPVLLSQWRPGQDGFDPGCDPCASPFCASEDVVVWNDAGSGRRLMAVATLGAGIYLVDVSNPSSPFTVAHYRYTWDGRNSQGDPVPGLGSQTEDIEISADGRILYTVDQSRLGGHLIAWDVQEILQTCFDSGEPCVPGDVEPLGEFFPDDIPPGFAHKMLPDGPYLWVTWLDHGVLLLDPRDPADIRELARRDVLASHPDDPLAGQWGAYGLALAQPCDETASASHLLVSDVGAFNSGGPLVDGGVEALRWEGDAVPLEPLRIAKDPASPESPTFGWAPAPLSETYRIYAGALGTTPAPPTGHLAPAPAWCGRGCCQAELPEPFSPSEPLEYFLLRPVNACGFVGSLSEGTVGPREDPLPGDGCN